MLEVKAAAECMISGLLLHATTRIAGLCVACAQQPQPTPRVKGPSSSSSRRLQATAASSSITGELCHAFSALARLFNGRPSAASHVSICRSPRASPTSIFCALVGASLFQLILLSPVLVTEAPFVVLAAASFGTCHQPRRCHAPRASARDSVCVPTLHRFLQQPATPTMPGNEVFPALLGCQRLPFDDGVCLRLHHVHSKLTHVTDPDPTVYDAKFYPYGTDNDDQIVAIVCSDTVRTW